MSGGDSPERQHQRFSSVRSNDLLAERRTDRTRTTPHPQPPERLRTDRSPLARPSPTTAWALSPPQTTLKPLPQQTIFWALWGSQITLKDECKVSMRSQLTTQLSGGDSPERQHQRFSSVRSNDLLAERRTDRTRTTPHPQPPERLRTDRSPLARPSPTTAWALSPPQTTLKPLPQQTIFWALWGSQITLKDECKVSMRSQLTFWVSGCK